MFAQVEALNIENSPIFQLQNVIFEEVGLRLEPWISWSKQRMFHDTTYKVFDTFYGIKGDIIKGIENGRYSIFITGLSGLGKTRFVYEVVQTEANIHDRVLYYDLVGQDNDLLRSAIESAYQKKQNTIFIIDNCNQTYFFSFCNIIEKIDSRLSIICIHNSFEELKKTSEKFNIYNFIPHDFETIIYPFIKEYSQNKLDDRVLEQIRLFSSGFISMAISLVDASLESNNFEKVILDDHSVEKILGVIFEDKSYKNILKSISIFNGIGFTGERKREIEFILSKKSISKLEIGFEDAINVFGQLFKVLEGRNIIEKRGGIVYIKPIPLALNLAKRWWEEKIQDIEFDRDDVFQFLESVYEIGILDRLCEQLSYLTVLKDKKEFIDNILSEHFLGDAKILNTRGGSRIFRALAEVDPSATVTKLSYLFQDAPIEFLLNIEVGRRNLVWALEKLCFRKDTFEQAIKVLFAFAVAENESYGNNATNQFLQLFHIYLSGTQADLEQRLDIINYGRNHANSKFNELAIKAMGRGLKNELFNRWVGAENQGSGTVLEEYKPQWQEVIDYWQLILIHLTSLVVNQHQLADLALQQIEEHILGMYDSGLSSIITPLLEKIIHAKGKSWREGNNKLRFTKSVLLDASPLIIADLDKLISLLEPDKNDLAVRFERIVTLPSWDKYKRQDGQFIDIAEIEAKEFAAEIIHNNIDITPFLPILYTKEQRKAYAFGERFGELSQKNDGFIDKSIDVLSKIDKKEQNINLLAGFLDAQKDRSFVRGILTKFIQNPLIWHHSFQLTRVFQGEYQDIEKLFKIVDKEPDLIYHFTYLIGYGLKNLENEEIIKLCQKIEKYGKNGVWVAFDLLQSFTKIEEDKSVSNEIILILKKWSVSEDILQYLFSEQQAQGTNVHRWEDTVIYILQQTDDINYANILSKNILEHYKANLQSRILNHSHVLPVLLKKYFPIFWKYLKDFLLNFSVFLLKFDIGSHNGSRNSKGILFENDTEENCNIIFDWCKENPIKAPACIACLMPVFAHNTNRITWYPFAMRIIDEFGNQENVLHEISANLGSYGISGSAVPYLKDKKELFEQLRYHKYDTVKNWAQEHIKYVSKQIEFEKMRDEEGYL